MSFHRDLHIKFIKDLDSRLAKQSYEYWLLEHLRMNGLYWAVMALDTVGSLSTLPKKEVTEFVLLCFDDEKGAFAAFPGHDSHVLTTLSALQILLIYDAMDLMDAEKRARIARYVLSLRQSDGSFAGDEFGEIDTRFVFVSLFILTVLGQMTEEVAAGAREFILGCKNFDGGFGMFPGAESHAAQVYTCVGALALCDSLLSVNAQTASWLSERQTATGGFNGRPEKLPDVCYSWWVLLSLSVLGKADWISFDALEAFILLCQDPEMGGFADRPDNKTDVYHTCFAIAGLALMFSEKYGLKPVDPVLCLPQSVSEKVVFYKNSA